MLSNGVYTDFIIVFVTQITNRQSLLHPLALQPFVSLGLLYYSPPQVSCLGLSFSILHSPSPVCPLEHRPTIYPWVYLFFSWYKCSLSSPNSCFAHTISATARLVSKCILAVSKYLYVLARILRHSWCFLLFSLFVAKLSAVWFFKFTFWHTLLLR